MLLQNLGFSDLLRVHEYERQRLGQELHDSAGQLLVSLELSIAHLREVEATSEHQGLIDEISDTVQQIDREIRALAFLHFPALLDDRGVCEAIRSLARGFERRTGIDVDFKCDCDSNPIDQKHAVALLRVTQEALVNIHRHAHASSATICLRKRANSLELTISDNGIGITLKAVTHVPGVGLRGMQHRIEALGGRLRITSLKRGTRLHAVIPLATAPGI